MYFMLLISCIGQFLSVLRALLSVGLIRRLVEHVGNAWDMRHETVKDKPWVRPNITYYCVATEVFTLKPCLSGCDETSNSSG